MGTPEFAIPALRALHERFGVKAVVTVPDKPSGRGKKLHSSPIAMEAQALQIPLLQPAHLKEPNFVETIASLKPDIIVVIAFRILPKEVYSLASMGAFNIHGSLLPKYRGAAPIQWSIINGETETGLTAFLLNDVVDTGKILSRVHVSIAPDMTAGELFSALTLPAAELAISTCEALISGTAIPIPQDDSEATPAPKLFRDQCKIDWHQSAETIRNLIRGTNPKPGAWTIFNDKSLKVLKASINNESRDLLPGSYVITDAEFLVGTASHVIALDKIQEEGKSAMSITDFLRGYRGSKQGMFT